MWRTLMSQGRWWLRAFVQVSAGRVGGCIEGYDLALGVDAGVGAAGPSYAHLPAVDTGDGLFQFMLNGGMIGPGIESPCSVRRGIRR